MTDSYQGHDASGHLFSFRKSAEPEAIDLFLPSDGSDSKKVSYSRFASHIRQQMAKDGGAFPEEVHAAVFILQQNLTPGVKQEEFKIAALPWGAHHPRMWRGKFFAHTLYSSTPMDPVAIYGATYTQSIVAAESLFDGLEDLFRYVEPSQANMSAYGHKFRELLILACTEVEASCKGILLANVPTRPQYNLTTNQYVKLNSALRLSEWKIALHDYPNCPEFNPFGQWRTTDPTTTLPWYAAYHAVKHDREGSFVQASLEHTLNAISAVYILQCAQWGPETFNLLGRNRRSPFTVSELSQWMPGEYYVPEIESDEWKAVPFFPTGL